MAARAEMLSSFVDKSQPHEGRPIRYVENKPSFIEQVAMVKAQVRNVLPKPEMAVHEEALLTMTRTRETGRPIKIVAFDVHDIFLAPQSLPTK